MNIQGGGPLGHSSQGPGQGLNLDLGQKTGTFNGQKAVTTDSTSRLASAAEEMTFAFSSKVEEKEAGKRGVRAESRLQMMRIEDINEYLDKARSPHTPEKMAALAKRMLSPDQSPYQLARQESDDPTSQYLMLQFALQQGERDKAPSAALDALRNAIAVLEHESGGAIHAGLNSIDAASEFGDSAASVQGFQNTYRKVVDSALGSSSLVETLKLALERFGKMDFQRGLKGLMKALGADVAAARPSTDPRRLQALIQDVYQLEVFNTLLDESEKLGKSLARHHGK